MPRGLTARPQAVAGIEGLTRGAGRNRAWSAVRGSSILVVSSRGSTSDAATLMWMWNSLVLKG